MKKVLIAMCAMAAVMACTKTEATFEQPAEISFSPVSRYNTKAVVNNGLLPSEQSFYVFANTVETESKKYFENILFTSDGNNKINSSGAVDAVTDNNIYQVYKADPAQFWPNALNLKFAGVTKTGNINNNVTPEMKSWGTLVVDGYVQPDPHVEGQNDLMWFYDENGDTGYGKSTSYVQPTMQHACSWITINVKADADLVEGSTPYWSELKVTEVKFLNLLTTGNATFSKNAVAWETTSTSTSTAILETTDNAKIISTTAVECANIANNTIVIPQAPTKLSVTYTYKTRGGVTITEIADDLDLAFNGTEKWAAGTHYTYDLTITANEIKIAPKSTEWATPTTGNFTQDIK